jgi:hypothetical protein
VTKAIQSASIIPVVKHFAVVYAASDLVTAS